MELCASRAVSDLPVTFTVLAGNPQLRPRHAFSLKMTLPSRSSRSLDSRYRHFYISLPRAAASDDSSGFSPYITEESDSVVTLEESPYSEKLEYSEVETSEVPKEEPVEDAQEQTIGLLNELKFESGDAYNIILFGTSAFVGLWLVSAIVGAIDSIPLFPKLLEVVGLGYTLWFANRFLIFKESREELAAKIDEVKEQILGSDDN